MRFIAPAFGLFLLSSSAAAGPNAPIDLAKLPERCRAVAEIPHSARSAGPAFAARVSAASCLADVALADVPLMDNDASIKAVDAAARPIIATLDEVIARGDTNWQMIALYMKGDLLFGLQARLRSTIPPVTPQMSLDAAQAIERRHDALEPKLEHWGAEATATLRQFSALARANPQVVGASPVLQSMAQRTEGLL